MQQPQKYQKKTTQKTHTQQNDTQNNQQNNKKCTSNGNNITNPTPTITSTTT